MSHTPRICVLAMSALALAACAQQGGQPGGWFQDGFRQDTYRLASATQATGSEFNRRLHDGYVELAAAERSEYDWADSDRFARKALAAAADREVAPDALHERRVPGQTREPLLAARKDLLALFEQGGRDKAPRSSAEAQLGFDCWIQEQEENRQPADIAACRDRFRTALAEAKAAMGLPDDAHVVYFETGSAKLSTAELQKLMLAASEAKSAWVKVLVSGHTDGVGTSEKNEALSAARAKAVTDMLITAGVKAGQIQAKHFGAERPAVQAKAGKPVAKNRRVEVRILR